MKKMNKKGFTLIELLAVVVILAILVTVSVPAVIKYLGTARKGTYSTNALNSIDAVKNDYLINGYTSEKKYSLDNVNALLDKKLVKSPYSSEYDASSYITAKTTVVTDERGVETTNVEYSICLIDEEGNAIGTYDSTTKKLTAIVEADINDTVIQNVGAGTKCE